ncbi:SERPINE1 mRNA-binding protein 1-like [Centruroides vittatus]|uniref:SERPINE1 mRNA-binding protein 1-like n=1 Tax=Centruroides vittatus TaxID=120091 RepID=UPI00350F655D
MENTYGIGVKNRYELFYNEEEDPLEILKQQEEERERRKAEKLQKDKTKIGKIGNKETKVIQSKKNLKETTQINNNKVQENTDALPKPRNSKPFIERTGKQGSREEPKEIEERKNRRNREERLDRPPASVDIRDRGDSEFRRGRGRGGRGRGRGRGGGGGGGGGGSSGGGFGNYDNRGKREFDRQSGSDKSGVKFVDKRDGAGAHNWGVAKDEMEVQWNPPSDENPELGERSGDESLPVENNETKENEPTTIEENPESIEEGPKEMTLDEWKREQESKRSVPKFNLRKPGEGEDTTQWKKLYVLKKKAKEDDDDEEEDDDDIEEEEEFGRRGRQRHLVDIQINFSDSRRGRGRGRGGRGLGGRGRGGMNRGGAKGPKSEQLAPRVDDWNDFPSLITA